MEAAFWRLQRQFPPTMWSTLFHAWCVPSPLSRGSRGQKDEGSSRASFIFRTIRPSSCERGPLVLPRQGVEGRGVIEGVEQGRGGGRKKKKQRALKLLNESRCFKGWFFASLWFLVDFKNISFKKEIGPVNFFFFFFLSWKIYDMWRSDISESLSLSFRLFRLILGYLFLLITSREFWIMFPRFKSFSSSFLLLLTIIISIN